jgi:hypothetical protein
MRRGVRSARGWNVAMAIALAGALIAASPVDASDTIGETFSNTGGSGCSDGTTYVQTASDGNQYVAPYDGVITSWTNSGFYPTMTFKVARIGVDDAYTVLAQDGPRTTGFNISATYPVRIGVRQGDVLGLSVPETGSTVTCGGPAAYSTGVSAGDAQPGPHNFDDVYSGNQLSVSAQIERDVDGDNYGDETQDGCPGNAATHGPCPLPKVLGQTFDPHYPTCMEGTVFPLSSPAIVSAVQTDGVITSWSYQSLPSTSGTVGLKVLQPLGGNSYLVRAQDAVHAVKADALNTFAVRIPVRTGDRIAINTDGVPVCGINSSDWTIGERGDDPGPGTSGPYTTGTGLTVDLAAREEADVDDDGYGDTTQDKCPTDASTQGACPPPPGPSAKCKAAKTKLDKAKKKLKKAKGAKHVKKAKVKKAKKKVKKAKAAVKKAC